MFISVKLFEPPCPFLRRIEIQSDIRLDVSSAIKKLTPKSRTHFTVDCKPQARAAHAQLQTVTRNLKTYMHPKNQIANPLSSALVGSTYANVPVYQDYGS